MTTTQPLTPNQVIALRAIRAAGSAGLSTQRLIETTKDERRRSFTEDAARNLLNRLEKRGCISGNGKGRTRVWTYVANAELDISLGPAEPPAASSNGASAETGIRVYVVLESSTLEGLVLDILDREGVDSEAVSPEGWEALRTVAEVFEPIARPEARNTEHALRTAAKDVYADTPDAAPKMVAVASRMFQTEVVRIKNSSTVSIGS